MKKLNTILFSLAFVCCWSLGTNFAQAQVNDLCSGALPITCGQTLSGATLGAGSDSEAFCGTGDGSGGGVWYQMVGNGQATTITLCNSGTNYDTKLRVYTGSCSSLVCEAGNDDASCSFSSLRSTVNFTSTTGTTYYILVHGFGSSAGTFQISATCAAPAGGFDICAGALPITCGQTVSGSTSSATVDNEAFCGTGDGSAGGVWYQFIGNGQSTSITTCNSGTNYDTKLRVYSGSCASLTCVAGNDDASCSFGFGRSTVNFTSNPGQVYYVLVHGYGSSTGNFQVSVSCTAPPVNDNCVTATPLAMASSAAACSPTAVSTIAASQSSPNPSCTSISNNDDVWYFFVATSSSMQVEFTNISGGVSVGSQLYHGSCAGPSLGCDFASTGFPDRSDVYSGLFPGQIYYLRVWIPGSSTSGTFDMCVFAPPVAPCNDQCSGAVCAPPLTCGASVQGNTTFATVDNAPTCGTSNGSAGGVWYRLIGDGSCYTLTTCNAFTNYDTKIRVYEGTCSSPICVTGDDDDACSFSGLRSRVTFTSTPGTIYNVLVHGFGSSVGQFQLDVACATPPSNDNCSSATPITVSANQGACVSTSVSSICASASSPASSCGGTGINDDVWYSFVATASGVQVQFTNIVGGFSVGSELYEGSCAGTSMGCDFASAGFPDVSDGYCGLQVGQVYYLRVWVPGSTTQGSWDMCVFGTPSSVNNDCGNATPVAVGSVTPFTLEQCDTPDGPSPGAGSNSCSSQDGWCSFETVVHSDVWYTFQAPASGCVTIVAAGFDTQLGLWSGGCGSLTEIAANDDDGDLIISNATVFAAGIIEASCLTAGQTYWIQIDGFGGQRNSGNLHVIDCGNAPLAADAGACQSAFVNGCFPTGSNSLLGSATGGFAPYTYSWSGANITTTSCQGDAVEVGCTGVGVSTYTLTVTDAHGCTATSTVDVHCIEAGCQAGSSQPVKFLICHTPPGEPGNPSTLCVGNGGFPTACAAVQHHLANHPGDYQGECGNASQTCNATNPPIASGTACQSLADNFDGGASSSVWASISGQGVGNGCGAVSGDALYFNSAFGTERSATTISVSTSGGGSISFDLMIGTGLFPTTCENADFNEGVELEYSVDGGSTWVTIASYAENAFASYTTVTEALPSAAQNCAAQFRVIQPNNSGSNFDNWSIDNFSFDCNPSNKEVPSAEAPAIDWSGIAIAVDAYPNPFSTSTVIEFSTSIDAEATVEIYSLTGVKIASIFNGDIMSEVMNKVEFDGSELSSGIYLYKITLSTGDVKIGKLIHD